MSLAKTIERLAARPHGVNVLEMSPEWTPAQAAQSIKRLVRAGRLVKGKRTGYFARWFVTAALRDAWLAAPVRGLVRIKPGLRDQPSRHERKAIGMYQPAPWPADALAVVPDHVVVQQCPSAPPRFTEHVFPFVHGGLRAA